MYVTPSSHQRYAKYGLYQIFRRVVGRDRHPNVLPVIEVSESLFPFCVMIPWMLDGNIIQYTQMNPNADRLMLVRAFDLKVCVGNPLTAPTKACTSLPGPHVSSSAGYSSW